jgi:PPOX class probable F420-dependent enzyme
VAVELPPRLKEILDDKVFVAVATIQPDGRPQVSPVWAKRDGDEVLISTTRGRRKTLNMERDPRVTVLVNPPEEPYSYAEIRGTATLVEDPSGELIDELSLKYTGKRYAEFNAAAAEDAPRVIVRVSPRKIVGQGLD